MHDIVDPTEKIKQQRRQLARIRRCARKSGFRVLRDWAGNYSLINTKITPPRALVGLVHVPLLELEGALLVSSHLTNGRAA